MENIIPIRPVSAHLTLQLRAAVSSGLRVWLDAQGDYSHFVDALKLEANFPIVAWRKSYVETMLALGELVSGTDDRSALLHMPAHNKESILSTPLLEFYRAGKLFEKNLHTLIEEAASGKVTPFEIRQFLSSGEVTLERADIWLAQHSVIAQGGLEARLIQLPPELFVELLYNPDHELLEALQSSVMSLDQLWEHLHRSFGLDQAWRDFAYQPLSNLDDLYDMRAHCQAIGFALICWCLSVEYVHDLRRDPFVEQLRPLRALQRPLVETARQVAQSLRAHDPARYESVADEFEPQLDLERQGGDARELGKIDTFRFEQRRIMEAALEALGKGEFDDVRDWAQTRRAENSFWVRHDPARDTAWRLVGYAAELGVRLTASPRPLKGAMSLPEAVELYVEQGAEIDRAHRVLEQRRSSLLDTRLPLYSQLRIALDGLRRHYRKWADQLAIDFNQLCLDHGFRPTESLQQRYIFDQEVREHALELTPHSDPPIVFFMVDALRFEMAQELYRDLSEESGVSLTLKPRLAELPTITAVGMNALAPVTQHGLLYPIIKEGKFYGMRTQEFQVVTPDDRRKAMHHRINGRTCPGISLRQVLDDTPKTLKQRIGEAALLVVTSRELDESGEKGLGPATFETTLRDLRVAVQLLRAAGVEHFVFSSDHGFLLLDQTAVRDAIPHGGKKTGVERRHLFYPVNAIEKGKVSVSLSGLGYADQPGFLVLPQDTVIFDRGARNHLFVHGGNSLQERLIPVLHVRFKRRAGANLTPLKIKLEQADGIMGLHALKIFVEQNTTQGALPFGGARQVDLALRPHLSELQNAPRVEVEIADVRGAELRGGSLRAPIGSIIEVFFKLTSQGEVPKLEVEVYAPTRRPEEVAPARSEKRFSVIALSLPPLQQSPPKTPPIENAVALLTSPQEKADETSLLSSEALFEGGDELLSGEVSSTSATDEVELEQPFAHGFGSSTSLESEVSEALEYGGWEALPQDGTQEIFEHIARYGRITEEEAIKKLGSSRQFRRFSRHIDEYISHVSFNIRIENISGTKIYVLQKG